MSGKLLVFICLKMSYQSVMINDDDLMISRLPIIPTQSFEILSYHLLAFITSMKDVC